MIMINFITVKNQRITDSGCLELPASSYEEIVFMVEQIRESVKQEFPDCELYYRIVEG